MNLLIFWTQGMESVSQKIGGLLIRVVKVGVSHIMHF
jgi:hypothetical protein